MSSVRKANTFVRWIAREYNATGCFGKVPEEVYVDIDISRSRRIAAAYEALPVDNSRDPIVDRSYSALGVETLRQWEFATHHGLKFEPWRQVGQPYICSAEMMQDVRNNQHLYFYQGGDPHPILGKVDATTGLSVNDKFRAVHDLFGHAAEGYSFGPRGEENAWLKHSQMFSGLAQKALTTETRGQNCWVNFGAQNFDETGNHKNLPLRLRPYAPQKVALLPDEFSNWEEVLR